MGNVWIGFKNWILIVIPLYVIFVALALLLNFMIALDKGIYLVMIIIPTIIFIVGISDIVHMLDCYKHYLQKGFKKLMALKFTFNDIGKAMFLTSLTSSIGFISLITINHLAPKEKENGILEKFNPYDNHTIFKDAIYKFLEQGDLIIYKLSLQFPQLLFLDFQQDQLKEPFLLKL